MYMLFDYSCRQRLNNEDININESCCEFFDDDVVNINDDLRSLIKEIVGSALSYDIVDYMKDGSDWSYIK